MNKVLAVNVKCWPVERSVGNVDMRSVVLRSARLLFCTCNPCIDAGGGMRVSTNFIGRIGI